MSWTEIIKAEKLNSYDETNAFANVLVELGQISNMGDLLYFYEKPYKWQNEYEDLLKIIEEHFGEPASITEIIDDGEGPLNTKAFEYFQKR